MILIGEEDDESHWRKFPVIDQVLGALLPARTGALAYQGHFSLLHAALARVFHNGIDALVRHTLFQARDPGTSTGYCGWP